MTDARERTMKLIELAARSPEDDQEGRTSAVIACRLMHAQNLIPVPIAEYQYLLGLAKTHASRPQSTDAHEHDEPITVPVPGKRGRKRPRTIQEVVSNAAGEIVAGVVRNAFTRR